MKISLPELTYNSRIDNLDCERRTGTANARGSVSYTTAEIKLRGRTIRKKGETYLKYDKFGVKITIGSAEVDMYNFSHVDHSLWHFANNYVRNRIKSFINALTPGLENTLSDTFTEVTNKILKYATFDEIFPE